MKKKLLKWLKNLIFVGVGIAILYWVFADTDFDTMSQHYDRMNFFPVFVSMILGYIAYVLRGIRWRLVINPMGYEVKNVPAVASVTIGYLANLFIPRAGEVVRCATLTRTNDIPTPVLLGTVVSERIIDLILFFSAIALSLIFNTDSIMKLDEKYNLSQQIISTKVLIYALSSIGLIIILFFVYKFFTRKYKKVGLIQKLQDFVGELVRGFWSIRSVRSPLLFVAYTIAIWIIYLLMVMVVFYAFEESSSFSVSEALLMIVASSIGIILPTPGGLGSFHASMMIGMVVLGINKDIGLLFGTVIHTSQALMTIVTGGISLLVLYIMQSRTSDKKI